MVVDYILYDRHWLRDLAHCTRDCRTYWVGCDIDLATLEQRERARATSPVGHARSHYDTVHGTGNYDLRVNLTSATPVAVAQTILQHVDTAPPVVLAALSQSE